MTKVKNRQNKTKNFWQPKYQEINLALFIYTRDVYILESMENLNSFVIQTNHKIV